MITSDGKKFYFVNGDKGTTGDFVFAIPRPVLQYTTEDNLELGATFLGFKIVSLNTVTDVFKAVSPDGFWVNLSKEL
jgi:hypothetical protein